ncbi:YihY/virulence factor BrkB family protein [Sphingomonas yunnanensis]|uniref:YihY/virulence factor BrkB family protein n=1 Tax=Sphingomonas yunnanensis TaxID=310400 RepID=UPI001CA71484|nr:YihY/virulence factor BrkB family protein [Sphingomonas yunnanensis]MBY9062645.1 YihY/virulence factor BrkB family protein [Sphingomonas yunnanensis]
MRVDLSSADLWRSFRADWWGQLKRAYTASDADNLGLIAAGAAFYIISSIAPILAVTVLGYGLFADAQTVQEDIRALFAAFPRDVAVLIGQQLDTVVSGSQGKKGLGILLALAIALYGGSKAATSMMTALNVAYEVKDKRSFVTWTLTSFAIVLAGVVLVLTGIAASALAAFIGTLIPWFPAVVLVVIRVATYLALALLVITGASLLFRFGPYRHGARLRWATPGTVVATAVWLLANVAFSLYVANFGNYGATYGSLSAIIVVLTWLWISVYAFLLGAALDVQAYRGRAGHAAISDIATAASRG